MFDIVASYADDLGGLHRCEQFYLGDRDFRFHAAVFAKNIAFDRADLVFQYPAVLRGFVLGLKTNNAHKELQERIWESVTQMDKSRYNSPRWAHATCSPQGHCAA